MKTNAWVWGAISGLVLAGCGSDGSSTETPAAPVDSGVVVDAASDAPAPTLADKAARYLIGSFDSEAQSKTDVSYFAISLVMCRVSVPELGPRVLYVEQAKKETLTAPYRQRLYVVEDSGDHVVSRVFEFKSPKKMVGWCANVDAKTVAPTDVEERAGCAVALKWSGDHFEGGTEGKTCESTLNGASYATSEVFLGDKVLRSWDRGFDTAGAQMWGATKGPYVFDRKSALGE